MNNPVDLQNNNNDDGSDSIILNLESLTKEYDTLLIKYNQALANYSNYLQQNNPKRLVYIKDQSFWGTGSISQQKSASVDQCQALCSNTANCSGATFNKDTQLCSLRSGEGSTIPSSSNDYAIVNEGLQLLNIVNGLNMQLINVNKQILDKINNGKATYNTQVTERQQQNVILEENYDKLVEERRKIEVSIHEYESLDKAESDGNIAINQNYYSFLLLLAVSIVVFIILYKFSGSITSSNSSSMMSSFQTGGGELGINVYYIIFAIILLILFFDLFI